jgi:hypothetical protein
MKASDYKPGVIEELAGSPAAAIGTTALAAGFAVATPIAIFLPPLMACWAGLRQQERLNSFIVGTTESLNRHEAQLNEISETQFQMISEAVVSALHTVDARKLDMLRHWIDNSFEVDVPAEQSAFVARAIRDISPEEAYFLLSLGQKPITTSNYEVDNTEYQYVDPDSKEYLAMVGLVSLGLLRDQGGFGSVTTKTVYADVVCQLIANPR